MKQSLYFCPAIGRDQTWLYHSALHSVCPLIQFTQPDPSTTAGWIAMALWMDVCSL